MLAGMKAAFDLGTGQSHRGPPCLLPGLQVPKGTVWVTLGLPGLQGLGACCGNCRIWTAFGVLKWVYEVWLKIRKKWQARAAAGRFPLTSHPLADPWECRDSINILSHRNASLPARASKGNSCLSTNTDTCLPPLPQFLTSQCRICQQQNSQTFCLCHQSKWGKGGSISSLETHKSHLDTVLAIVPGWPCLTRGALARSLPSSAPSEGSGWLRGYAKVKWDLHWHHLASSLSKPQVSQAGHAAVPQQNIFWIKVWSLVTASIQRTLLGPFLWTLSCCHPPHISNSTYAFSRSFLSDCNCTRIQSLRSFFKKIKF